MLCTVTPCGAPRIKRVRGHLMTAISCRFAPCTLGVEPLPAMLSYGWPSFIVRGLEPLCGSRSAKFPERCRGQAIPGSSVHNISCARRPLYSMSPATAALCIKEESAGSGYSSQMKSPAFRILEMAPVITNAAHIHFL